MTKSTREYTMTLRKLSWLLKHRGVTTIYCHHPNCREPIQVGQDVVSKEGNNRRHYYHKQCYWGSFIEVTA